MRHSVLSAQFSVLFHSWAMQCCPFLFYFAVFFLPRIVTFAFRVLVPIGKKMKNKIESEESDTGESRKEKEVIEEEEKKDMKNRWDD